MIVETLLWGLIIGLVNFVLGGVLYLNPRVAKIYKEAGTHPSVKQWSNQKEYVVKMFLGTQVEMFILAGAYFFLRQFSPEPANFLTALVLGIIFSLIRVYPRFWNMWVQSTYPKKLLIIEFVNGIICTMVVVCLLAVVPV